MIAPMKKAVVAVVKLVTPYCLTSALLKRLHDVELAHRNMEGATVIVVFEICIEMIAAEAVVVVKRGPVTVNSR